MLFLCDEFAHHGRDESVRLEQLNSHLDRDLDVSRGINIISVSLEVGALLLVMTPASRFRTVLSIDFDHCSALYIVLQWAEI
jgi:hypothetical protein